MGLECKQDIGNYCMLFLLSLSNLIFKICLCLNFFSEGRRNCRGCMYLDAVSFWRYMSWQQLLIEDSMYVCMYAAARWGNFCYRLLQSLRRFISWQQWFGKIDVAVRNRVGTVAAVGWRNCRGSSWFTIIHRVKENFWGTSDRRFAFDFLL